MERSKMKSISRMYKYLSFCRERENFRAQLVDVIKIRMKKCKTRFGKNEKWEEEEGGDEEEEMRNVVTKSDKDILRYYYYLTEGIDEDYVGSMDAGLLENILSIIPMKWRQKYKGRLNDLVTEAKEEYTLSVKMSLVEFVIGDSLYDLLDEVVTLKELKTEAIGKIRLSTDHAINYRWNRIKVERTITLYRPVVRRIFDYSYREFSVNKLIDENQLATQGTSYELASFERCILRMCHKARENLVENWLPKIRAILAAAYEKNELPLTGNASKCQRFFNCIALIMEDQLRRLYLQSLDDYIDYLRKKNDTCYGFDIKVIVRNTVVSFEPSFKTFVETLSTIMNSLREAVDMLPRVETFLPEISCFEFNDKLLQPRVSEKRLKRCADEIRRLIEKEKVEATLQLREFDKYESLINGSESVKLEELMRSTDTTENFQRYQNLIEYYDRLSKQVKVGFARTSFHGFFLVHRGELIGCIASTAGKLKEDLIAKMISEYQQKSRAIGNAYQQIVDRALSVPANTTELIDLKQFIHVSETESIDRLRERLKEIIKYIVFLSDYSILTPIELKTNNFAFQW